VREGVDALKAGRIDDAVDAFTHAHRGARLWSEAHHQLGRALLARGKRDESRDDLTLAEEYLDNALLLTPDLDLALVVRAEVRLELGRVEAALVDARDAIARRPDLAEPCVTAARALLVLERYDEAIDHCDQAFRTREHAEPLYYAAVALERQGHRLRAFETLEQLYNDFGAPEYLKVAIGELYARLEQR
jgi:tetratricopeptide (TPR) repeat protein